MARLLALIAILLLGLSQSRVALADYEPPGLSRDTNGYVTSLMAKAPPQPNPQLQADALRQARAAVQQKNPAGAIPKFEQAITNGGASPAIWLELGSAWASLPTPNRERAVQSAFQSYRSARKDEERVAALWQLSEIFEAAERPEDVIAVLRALRELAPAMDKGGADARAQAVESRLIAARQKIGLRLKSVDIATDDGAARVCFAFNEPLSTRRGVRFEDFLKVEPPVPLAVESRDSNLCVRGMAYGNGYTVTLRQGLPGEDGVVARADETQRLRVPDRPAMVSFKGSSFILPRTGADGVPVVTVNADKVNVGVYRIGDRNLVNGTQDGRIFEQLTPEGADNIANRHGELVWKGTLATPGEKNKETVTALPFRQAVGDTPAPGIYVITAQPVDVPEDHQWNAVATQWVLVSDIGLTSFRGADGLTVFARAYSTAKPMPGVEIALVAHNNSELARVRTDEQGKARFAPGLINKPGGNGPEMVMAYAGADFAMLGLTAAAFDLSDRGVGGRPTPGPMDAYLYTDRGVYRQGETVNAYILLRDDKTEAVENFPLTVKVLRPSGTEYFSGPVAAQPDGGFFLPLTLSRTAPLGGWQIVAYTDPKGEPVGRATFQVDDFVPLKLAVEATPSAKIFVVGQPFEVLVNGRFFYGPPAAGLDGTAEVFLRPDPTPFPQFPDYRFGMAQDSFTGKLEHLEFPKTDDKGQSRIAVTLPQVPDTSRPLRAEVRLTLSEPGGRPARTSVTVPVRARSYSIGLHGRFAGGRIGEGQEAGFDVVAVGPDGTPVAKQDLSWELLEERTVYRWYKQNGRYNYRAIVRDVPISSGTLSVGADKPAVLSVGRRDFGRYRLEVVDKAANVASSIRFSAGWQTSDDSGSIPDKLEIASDRQNYKPGETARLRIAPPFAGEVLLTVATDRLFETRTLSVPAEGATVEVPVNADWGPGAYVTASVYRPPVKGRERQPVRALGVAWIAVDPAVRTLDVTLDSPPVARPRGQLEIGVKVAAVGGGPVSDAYVTLAAVDEGILRLTDFASPNPGAHFFGKRMLGIDIRDDYGRLIDALDGPFGAMRQGGDASGAGLPVVPFTVVSLFKGPVKVGADGIARITFDVPDFNGELRLMAVAYNRQRVGSAAKPVTIRDPLVADAVMPRFLAPGDDSRLTLSIHNVEAAEGPYAVTVEGRDAVAVEGGNLSVPLAKGERKAIYLPLKGVSAGIGRVALSVRGPDGSSVTHEYGITVRPGRPAESRFVTSQLAPGATARFDAADLAVYVPGTASWSASFSTAPPFDVGGILRALDRYPFGCVEQTVSRAFPLLVVRDVELALGTQRKPDDGLEARIVQAVSRTLDRQRFDGSFGLWSSFDASDDWLTAYAMEFLLRAREKGYAVPDKPIADGLDYLRRRVINGGSEPAELASRAYGLHVLTLAGVGLQGQARYLHDTALDRMPTPLAKGQLGAALARMGDAERANSAFDSALGRLAREDWHSDYGSTVRDAAALVSLLGEVSMATGPRLSALLDRLPASATAANRTTTQEQAWTVLAADALLRGAPAPVELSLPGGTRRNGARVDLTPTLAQLTGGLPVANAGKAAVWQAVSISGVPVVPTPAAREGLRIKRNFFTRAGETLNLDTVKQNDVFVIVLEGEANTKLYHQLALTQMLPAGWEIENANGHGALANEMDWLKDLYGPNIVEGRDDRYFAALDLPEDGQTFKLAFLVRAVTPGTYELPGATLEDMYKPRFFARQNVGRITVLPAQ